MITVERKNGQVSLSIPTIVDRKSWNMLFFYSSTDEFLLCTIAEKAKIAIRDMFAKKYNDGYVQRDEELRADRRRYRANAKKRKRK